MGSKTSKQQNLPLPKPVKQVPESEYEKNLKELQESLCRLLMQLVDVDFVTVGNECINKNKQCDFDKCIEINRNNKFDERLVIVHTNILSGVNNQYFKNDTYKFGLLISENSVTSQNGKQINMQDISKKYKDDIQKYFGNKLDIYEQITGIFNSDEIKKLTIIMKNINKMLENIDKKIVKHYMNQEAKLFDYVNSVQEKLIEYVDDAIQPISTTKLDKIHKNVTDLITDFKSKLDEYLEVFSAFEWDCKNNFEGCSYIGSNAAELNINEQESLPVYNSPVVTRILNSIKQK